MKKTLLFTTVASGALAVASPALAQSAAPAAAQSAPQTTQAAQASEDEFPSEAIIVTARRRAEDVSKVPIAISAFSGEQLQARGIQNTLDLVKITPGLNIQGGGGKTNPVIVIRGQSKAITGNGSPGVLTYMNDVPLPTYGSLIQSYDMQNIQVLKGPQGTLFGRNSIGGAVLTVTKAPTYNFEGYGLVDIGQYDNMTVEGAINVPIVQDKIAIRVAAQLGRTNNHVKTFIYSPYTISNPSPGVYNATPGTLVPSKHDSEEFEPQSYRVSLLVEPTDWIKNVTVADYSKIRGQAGFVAGSFIGGIYSQTPAAIQTMLSAGSTDPSRLFFASVYANNIIPSLGQCRLRGIDDPRCDVNAAAAAAKNAVGDRVSYVTQDPWLARSIIMGVSNTTTIDLSEHHQIKNIFGFRTTDNFSNTTLTGLAVPIINSASRTRLKQTTEELQFAGSFFNEDLKYTVGGFYYNESPNGRGGYQALEVNTFFGLSHNLSTTYLKNESKAVYGQFDYSLSQFVEGLTLTAGARQTWDEQSACTTNVTFSPFGPAMVLTNAGSKVIPTEAECKAGVGTNVGTAQIFDTAKFKKLTFTVGANWQIAPSTMVYAVRRRGYRGGGYNTPTIDPFLSNLQTFAPEVLDDWEIGTKLRFRVGGMQGSLDFAAFTGKDKGNQLPIATSGLSQGVCVPSAVGTTGHAGSNCLLGATPGSLVVVNTATVVSNAGTLTIRGIEAAGTLSPNPFVTLSGSVSYVQAKVDSITLPANLVAYLRAANRPEPSDIQIQGQPKWTVNAGLNLRAPEKVLGGNLSGTLDFHYTGSTRQVELVIPSYNQFDLRVAIDNISDTGLSVAAYVKNLTNETIYQGGGATTLALGVPSYILGNPRIIGMQVRYAFGGR